MELILNTPILDEVKRTVEEEIKKNPQRKVSSITIEYATASKICMELGRSMSKKNIPDIIELLSEKIGYVVDIMHMLEKPDSGVSVFFEPTIADILTRKINYALDRGREVRYVRINIHEWEDLLRLKDHGDITVTRWETVTKLYTETIRYPRAFEYRGIPIVLEDSQEDYKLSERKN